MQIELRPVTHVNWEACGALELTAEQQGFLEPNVYSIAQAGYHPDNQVVHQLYERLGFIDYGDRFGKEMAVRYTF